MTKQVNKPHLTIRFHRRSHFVGRGEDGALGGPSGRDLAAMNEIAAMGIAAMNEMNKS
jgi:hypothetical protein